MCTQKLFRFETTFSNLKKEHFAIDFAPVNPSEYD